MPVPPVESVPQILLRFTTDASPELLTAVKKHLESNDLIILSTEYEKEDGAKKATTVSPEAGSIAVIAITTSQSELELQAQRGYALRATTPARTLGNVSIMEEFTVQNRKRFIPTTHTGEQIQDYVDFSSGERIGLCFNMLEKISVLNIGENENDLTRIFDNMGISYLFGKGKVAKARSIALMNELEMTSSDSMILLDVLKEHNLLETITPVHFVAEREEIMKESWNPSSKLPIEKIKNYYGDEVAFYFSWLNFFNAWLIIPAIGGIVVNIIRYYNGDSIEDCEITPFFGMGVFIWACLFIRYWEREESRLSYKWGTFQSNTKGKELNIRPQFKGHIRISPVTGLPEKYYSPTRRRIKYIGSALITMIMLGIAFTVMVISLNLQGYVHPGHDEERWAQIPHPYYYPRIAYLSEEGQLFDCNSAYMSLVPAVLHAVIITTLNNIYRKIAEAITDWENHKTFTAHENSLILKRFIFEAFDCYIALFYLALFERDIKRLRGELATVFVIDMFRRMIVECIIPLALERLSGEKPKNNGKKNDDLSAPGNETESTKNRLLKESTLEEYEEFDDYLEMVIEFGYIVLFASAIPLGSTLAIVANFVELRTDSTKLARVLARPRYIVTNSIGTWKTLLNVIVSFSALTNCIIFGMTSSQLMQFMPGLYWIDDYGEKRWVKGKGYMVILVIVGIERFLLMLKYLIEALIPTVPEDVSDNIARCEYVKAQEAKLILFEKKGKDAKNKKAD